MHRRLSPQARLHLTLLLSSFVAAAGCRGMQGPDSTSPEGEAQPVPAGEIETLSQAIAGSWTGVSIPTTSGGSSSGSGSNFTVTGGGADIWGTADAFRFHYMTVTGNVTLTAQVTSQQNTDSFAKAGVMMRESLTAGPGARNVMTVLTPVAANGYRFQSRSTVGATTAKATSAVPQNTPGWVRIVRSGNNFTSFFSLNGSTWTQIGGTVTIAMPAAMEVGLAVSSHNAAALSTVEFANVTFNPPQTPPSPPLAPTNLVATAGNNQVGLTWTGSAGATSYTVKRSPNTTPRSFTNIQTQPGTGYIDTTATNGNTYHYVVSASNATGPGPDSTEATASPAAPLPPPAPTGIVPTAGNGQVSLTWTPVAGATSYNIKFNSDGGATYAPAGSSPTASFTHGSRTNGTQYFYVVSAVNAGGEGPNSTPAVSATPQAPPAPGAPATLNATPGNAQVMLTWSAVSGATSYTVKRSLNTTPRSFANVQTLITGTSYTNNTGLTNGTTYVYVVTATGAGGESPPSPERLATPVAPPPVTWQSKIIGTVASGASGSWSQQSATAHTISAGGADIYGTADNFRFLYQSISGDVTITARVQSLTNANTWTKAVVMIRENDTAAGARNVATVVSPTATNKYRRQVRSATGGSSTSAASTANSAIPSWIRLQRVGSTFTSFHSTNGTSWTQIDTSTTLTGFPTTAFVGLGVTSHTTTANTTATAVFTDVTVQLPAPPAVPAGLAATGQNNQVFLQWDPPIGATSYTVKQATSSSGPFSVIATNVADPFRAALGLTNGNMYWFTVSAQNSAGSSVDSAPVSGIPVVLRPSVQSVSPQDGAAGVDPIGFVTCEINAPNYGGGVDGSTLTGANVFLQRVSDGVTIVTTTNTSGGGDVIALQPVSHLEEGTEYRFTVTAGVRDTTGAAFMPFTSTFTTGIAAPPPPTDVVFDQVDAIPGTHQTWTSIAIGPDNKVYAGTITGQIYRFNINADGTLSGQTIINTVRAGNGNVDRAVIGMTFDPNEAAPVLWVTNGGRQLTEAPNWSGKLAKLSGTNLATYQDYVVNFPRSYKDHMTNSIAIKPGEPGVIYISQGSMNAMGAPDSKWGLRKEHLLSAAVLRVDTNAITTLPLNVQTNDNDETSAPGANGRYNPFAAGAPVTIYATGVRNAYDILWHSNGSLYTATNGSAANGSTPATPSPLPAACSRRIDQPTNGNYTGPSVPGLSPNPIAEDDYLYRVVQGGYYGHPNPARCEWVLNGGNPTSGVDNTETASYPVGVQKDRNWRGNAFNFGPHFSPNGMLEWKATSVPSLMGKLLIIRYSEGNDVITLDIDPATKDISGSGTTLSGMDGFNDPLDIAHNVSNGDVYVTEHTGQRIVRLRPRPAD